MTTGEWISLGSSVGALSAALVALFTLLELARQRKSAYKPDICVLKKQFSIKPGRMGKLADLPLAIDWVSKDSAPDNMISMASIRIVNVGFGAAKHLKTKCKFELETILEEINQMAQQTFQSFYLENGESLLSIRSKDKSMLMVNSKMDCHEFEYLLPVENQNNGHEVNLPPAYTLLVAVYLFLCIKEKRRFSEINVPKIKLELSFVDIGKNKHSSAHELECNINMMTQPAEDNDTSFPQFDFELIETA